MWRQKDIEGINKMSAIISALVTAMVIALVVIVIGVCSQGRLKHLLLIALGASTQKRLPTPFGEIPRSEQDWALLAPLKGIDPPKR